MIILLGILTVISFVNFLLLMLVLLNRTDNNLSYQIEDAILTYKAMTHSIKDKLTEEFDTLRSVITAGHSQELICQLDTKDLVAQVSAQSEKIVAAIDEAAGRFKARR